MSLTFVIPDLHGRVDLLLGAFTEIAAAEKVPAKRTIVFLGDYIDRGPWSRQILDLLEEGPDDGEAWICLKGNHEAMMVDAFRDGADRSLYWLANGGGATVASYGPDFATWDIWAADHVAWIDALPMIHIDTHRIYAHAGVDPAKPLRHQTERDLLWRRYEAGYRGGFSDPDRGDLHVVHGHTIDLDNPQTWGDRTCLDRGAYRHGRLCIGVFDDDRPGPPVGIIAVDGPSLADIERTGAT